MYPSECCESVPTRFCVWSLAVFIRADGKGQLSLFLAVLSNMSFGFLVLTVLSNMSFGFLVLAVLSNMSFGFLVSAVLSDPRP